MQNCAERSFVILRGSGAIFVDNSSRIHKCSWFAYLTLMLRPAPALVLSEFMDPSKLMADLNFPFSSNNAEWPQELRSRCYQRISRSFNWKMLSGYVRPHRQCPILITVKLKDGRIAEARVNWTNIPNFLQRFCVVHSSGQQSALSTCC